MIKYDALLTKINFWKGNVVIREITYPVGWRNRKVQRDSLSCTEQEYLEGAAYNGKKRLRVFCFNRVIRLNTNSCNIYSLLRQTTTARRLIRGLKQNRLRRRHGGKLKRESADAARRFSPRNYTCLTLFWVQ